jgi:hypothetical protein
MPDGSLVSFGVIPSLRSGQALNVVKDLLPLRRLCMGQQILHCVQDDSLNDFARAVIAQAWRLTDWGHNARIVL